MSPNRHLLIVDDDLLTREVLSLVAEEAGFSVSSCDSGEAALAHLALGVSPSALLVDMQMPGLCGDALAVRLRPACAPATLLIAMSGSPVAKSKYKNFDRFLLKPFQFHEFTAALDGAPEYHRPAPRAPEALDLDTYASLAASMPPPALHALYDMCLQDAERRLDTMQRAARAGDGDTFSRAAHSIKGACGMVGALELAAWASTLEQEAPSPIDDFDPFAYFAAATARLRAMLDSQPEQLAPGPAAHPS